MFLSGVDMISELGRKSRSDESPGNSRLVLNGNHYKIGSWNCCYLYRCWKCQIWHLKALKTATSKRSAVELIHGVTVSNFISSAPSANRLSTNRVRVSDLLYDWRFAANQFVLATSPLRLTTSTFFTWTLAVIVLMSQPLWWEDRSVVYSCFWLSPEQSFSSSSPVGLMVTFYCFRFETPQTWSH
jgi:hypothetical protein